MQHATRQGDAEIIQALHARIHQLEEMLASVGAGGVEPLNQQPHRQPLTDKELNLIASAFHLHLLEGNDKKDLLEFARAVERRSRLIRREPLTDGDLKNLKPKPAQKGWIYTEAQMEAYARKVERAHEIGSKA